MSSEELAEVSIEEAATRPPFFPFINLPLKLSAVLIGAGCMLFVLIKSTLGEFIVVGGDIMICFMVKPLVAMDYNGFDIFLVWLRLDFMCFDTRRWGGTRATTLPLRVDGFRGMCSV